MREREREREKLKTKPIPHDKRKCQGRNKILQKNCTWEETYKIEQEITSGYQACPGEYQQYSNSF